MQTRTGKQQNTADKKDRGRVCDCCRQRLSDFCSVTTGLLCTSFIVSLYLISLYCCHFPPPCLPPRHPAAFVFPLQQQNGLVLSSNLDLKGQRSALSLFLALLWSCRVCFLIRCFFLINVKHSMVGFKCFTFLTEISFIN